ncbi:MAG: hypothetical protein HWE30_11565 [Methylocystaceae bacterium]|nr:hypothetical protein [Methylocystaceae bacterium]
MKARDKAGASDQQAMMDREREWFEHYYGTDPVQFDETGKMVQPRPVRDVPKRSLAIKTKDGKDLEGAIDEIIRILPIKEKPGDDYSTMPVDPIDPKLPKLPGLPDDKVGIMPIVPPGVEKPEAEVIKGLQAGLNMLSNKQNQSPLPNTPKVQKLKEDGIAGPKTAFGLKKALVDQGTGKVSEAVALGQFKETVKKAKKDGPQNLAGELGATFGPLLGKKKAPKQGFQPEGLALQDTLNDLGAGLKDDGIVGPKTTDAFSQIAKTADEDDLVNRFGYNLGFDF